MESLCCTPKTTVTLCVHYTEIKKKKTDKTTYTNKRKSNPFSVYGISWSLNRQKIQILILFYVIIFGKKFISHFYF